MRLRRRHYQDALLIILLAGGALLISELRGRLRSQRLHPDGTEFVFSLRPTPNSGSLKVALVITFDGHIMGEVVQVLNEGDGPIQVRAVRLNGTHEAMVGWKLRNHFMPDPTVKLPLMLAPKDALPFFKAWNVGWEQESYRAILKAVSIDTDGGTYSFERSAS